MFYCFCFDEKAYTATKLIGAGTIQKLNKKSSAGNTGLSHRLPVNMDADV